MKRIEVLENIIRILIPLVMSRYNDGKYCAYCGVEMKRGKKMVRYAGPKTIEIERGTHQLSNGETEEYTVRKLSDEWEVSEPIEDWDGTVACINKECPEKILKYFMNEYNGVLEK